MSRIYEYVCRSCTIENDREYSFCLLANEPPDTPPNCPECGGDKIVRKWSPARVVFKGKGFYSTDNPKKGDDLPV